MIREATPKDAEEVCAVLRKSITDLCHLDHRGNETEIDEWLENKTEENCKKWIEHSTTNAFVAERNGKVVGCAAISHKGHVFLCYVLPEVKGQGFGGKLLQAAEASVVNLGVNSFSLESTLTAKGFYEHYGYSQISETGNPLAYAKYSKP